MSFLTGPFWFNPLTFEWRVVLEDYTTFGSSGSLEVYRRSFEELVHVVERGKRLLKRYAFVVKGVLFQEGGPFRLTGPRYPSIKPFPISCWSVPPHVPYGIRSYRRSCPGVDWPPLVCQ